MARLFTRMILVALVLACSLPPQCCKHHDRPMPMKQRAKKRCAASLQPIPIALIAAPTDSRGMPEVWPGC